MPIKSIWDRPQPVKTIGEVYDANGIQPGANWPALAPGTGIMQGGGQTITNERPSPATASAMPAVPGQPVPMPRMKPVNLPTTDAGILKTPGQDIVQGSRNLLDNILSVNNYLDANGGMLPGPVPMAGQPVMPGQPAVVPQPAQPTTTVTGAPTLEGTQGPSMLSVEELAVNPSNITGGGQPQKDVTQSVAPIQQTAFPTGTAGQQTAGAYDMMANGAVRQPGKLAAVASDMLARFGETGLIRMTSGNKAVPVAREYLRRKAAGEDVTMLKVAEDITGVSETGKTMDENQRKFEISNRAKNAETQRIADRATRDAEAAAKEQKAQWRTTATNMDSDIAKAVKGGTNETEIQDNIKGYFDTLTAMNYPMDKLRGTAKTIWNRVQKAISEGKTGEELNRAYYTGPKAHLDAGLETALIKNVTTMFEGRLDPNASMTDKDKKIGSIFPVKSFEQYKNDKKLQASHRINSQQDFEKELYNTGIGGGQSMKAAFEDFVKKVRNNSPKNAKSNATVEENALRLWKRALLTDESLNHAWMVNSNDDVSKQERQKPVESPNAPTGPAFTGNDAAGNAGLPAQPVAEAMPPLQTPAPTIGSNGEGFDSLPSGAEFTGPDGKRYRKK